MSESRAKAEVEEEEMKRRYAPNPWDAPGPRRVRPRRIAAEVGSGKEERCEGSKEGPRYSEEQWDLFERRVGYK